MQEERERRRATFDEEAVLYDEARPGYPDALFDDLVSLSGILPGGRVLEIGCGTGQATVPLARRGYRVFCVELGENLAAVARRNLSVYPQVRVLTGAFEDRPVEEGAFDLAISATAFHWLDPSVAYPKIARALKPGGAIGLFWNTHVRSPKDMGFFDVVQEVYGRESPKWAKPFHLPRPNEVEYEPAREIERTGLFGPAVVRRYVWDQEYDAPSYTRLLSTYSDHRSLEPAVRERLLGGIAELIDTRYGGRILKGYLAMLYVAHRR